MSKKFTQLIVFCVVLGLVTVSGCSTYRPELRQGQVVKTEDVEKVTVGMSAQEVLDILGTPLVTDVFNNQRWDYVYVTYDDRHNMTGRSRVTIFFTDDGAVNEIETDIAEGQELETVTISEEKPRKVRGWFKSVGGKISGAFKRDDDDNSVEGENAEESEESDQTSE